MAVTDAAPGMRWYRLATGDLGVASADAALASRFEEVLGECRVPAPREGPRVECVVGREEPGRSVEVRFTDAEPLDLVRFIEVNFPDRGVVRVDDAAGPAFRLPGDAEPIHVTADGLRAPMGTAWRGLAANVAVSRVLARQRNVLFFHAASLRMGRGSVMLCGPKRSGKTTLAVGLASRGHALLGDEVAALREADGVLLPYRRSLAVRAGPATAAGAAAVAQAQGTPEQFPDGEWRTRLAASALGAAPDGAAPLALVVLLAGFGERTDVREIAVTPAVPGRLGLLAASMWERPPALVAMRLLRLLAGVRVVELRAGPPDEAADAIEALMEVA